MEASELTTIIEMDDEDTSDMEITCDYHLDLHPPLKEYNILLDLDGTLISVVENNKHHLVKARPHLSYFMHYVFTNFKRVSIWTNASSNWYNYCYFNILSKNMPIGAKFDLIITADNGIITKKMKFDAEKYVGYDVADLPKNLYVKNLEYLYELYPDYRQDNTFILDDMPFTYSMNVLNAIPIKPYESVEDIGYLCDEDSELIRVVFQMKMVLFQANYFGNSL